MIFSLFYYIYKDKCKDDFKKFLNDAVENKWSVETLYTYIFDSIKKSSSEYIDPFDDEVCLKLDYEEIGTGTGEIKTVIRGYSLGYKPVMDNREEKKDSNKDELITKAMLVGGVLITGFILGKRSNKLRPLKKRERYVEPNFLWRRYPDIPNDTRMAIRDEVFDFIFDFMKANDIHFAKRRK